MNIKSLYIFVNERLGNTIINLDFWSEQISFKKERSYWTLRIKVPSGMLLNVSLVLI